MTTETIVVAAKEGRKSFRGISKKLFNTYYLGCELQ